MLLVCGVCSCFQQTITAQMLRCYFLAVPEMALHLLWIFCSEDMFFALNMSAWVKNIHLAPEGGICECVSIPVWAHACAAHLTCIRESHPVSPIFIDDTAGRVCVCVYIDNLLWCAADLMWVRWVLHKQQKETKRLKNDSDWTWVVVVGVLYCWISGVVNTELLKWWRRMFLALLCESEVTEVPEELAGVNPLLGVMMHLCS